MYKAAGIEAIKEFDNTKVEQVEKNFKKLNPNIITKTISKEQFLTYVEGFGEFYKNDLKQPLQIHYYTNDTLVSFHANCYAKGSFGGSLDWNYDGKFDEFIPKTSAQIKGNKGLNFIFNEFSLPQPKTKNTIIFFWSNLMPKQSLETYKLIVENSKISTGKSTLITINTDQFFAGEKI
ncbi:hypothetical protein [Sphingobacterium sp. 1.A.4]|uniref:hypothetical protein n=1 Tax=Sphingobacterium sp. 1.A.4 TaxID=2044603 RepID=UPI000C0C0A70|nr:hypothetical protein [Sphingobacterium sp. 1.A.4]